ncbi:MAG: CocE/NonD family hydrolase [Acidobacteriia bacterium]|nr:CocE/NonD family hydrolase [Terriglobia bacterium]
MKSKSFMIVLAVATAMSLLPLSSAQARPEAFSVKEHYTKYEYRIPMRDGKKLFTSVYVPKDTSHAYPFLMSRTPYTVSPYGVDQYRQRLGPSEAFDKAGYIFVFQDVRGRYLSEGTFVEMHPHIDNPKSNADVDESTDTYDTVEWLLKHIPNNNGRVGIWGISYPGFYTSASIIDSHPAIKAASPQAPMTDLFMGDDAYHGGAFMMLANFGFYTAFKPQPEPALPPKFRVPFDWGASDAYDFFLKMGPLANADKLYLKGSNPLWNDQVSHNTYDSYWHARDLSRHMKNIKCAVLTVGGWFDAEDLSGPFRTYHAISRNNPGTFSGLVIGPWSHGGWARFEGARFGRVEIGAKTSDYYRERILFPFFENYLKGSGEAKLPEVSVFETGTNVWRQYSAWPPAKAQSRTLYFHDGGRLSFDPPSEKEQAFDEYVSDPHKPVPYIGYGATSVPQEYMASDQRFAAKRPDVLVYETEPLENDITIAGPVSPHLQVSTSGTDSDWVVKLIDVYPVDYPETDNAPSQPRTDVALPVESMSEYQQLVRGEPFRGKFRNSFEKPEPFKPGEVSAVNFEMPDINHTFRRGHRIMVQVQSSWFPLVDLNPQTFVDIPNARPEDFKKATERVYHSKSAASGIVVGVMPEN